jgi:CheY-like chemotaxis protein
MNLNEYNSITGYCQPYTKLFKYIKNKYDRPFLYIVSMRNRNNILVVDDSKIKQKVLKNLLEKDGFNVYLAPTVSEGLYILGNNDIGIVLVDFYLAGINTGTAMVEKLRRYKVDVKIYSISSSEDSSIELLNAGCDGIISRDPKEIRKFLHDNYNQTDI